MLDSQQSAWIEGPAILCHGLRIGFRANRAEVLSGVESAFPPSWNATRSGKVDFAYSLKLDETSSTYQAYLGAQELIRTASHDRLLGFVGTHLQHTIAENAVDHLFVHAGAVGWHGKALLFPGRTCSGKSTLVRELIRAGAVYFSDEFAAIDSNGYVHPFARPLSLRTAGGKSACKPDELGARVATEAVPLGWLVATCYSPGAKWKPVQLSPGQAMLELLGNTVPVRANPGRAIQILKTAVSSLCTAIRSPRDEAGAAAGLILKLAKKTERFNLHKIDKTRSL